MGDVVDVKFGDRIPADIRILSSSGFKVNPLFILEENRGLINLLYHNGSLVSSPTPPPPTHAQVIHTYIHPLTRKKSKQ